MQRFGGYNRLEFTVSGSVFGVPKLCKQALYPKCIFSSGLPGTPLPGLHYLSRPKYTEGIWFQ